MGHTSKGCSAEQEMCLNCGIPHQISTENSCRSSPKYINCNEDHHTLSRECPTFKQNVEINKVMSIDNISYMEARRIVLKSRSINNKTRNLLEDQSNFLFLSHNSMDSTRSFAEISRLQTPSSTVSSSTRMEMMTDLFKRISTAPDQELLLQRLQNTINLHLFGYKNEQPQMINNHKGNDSKT